MSLHIEAPCIKDSITLHALLDRDLIDVASFRQLHTPEGCGNCPKNLGSCALLNSIGHGQITENQRVAIVSRLTT